MRERRFVATVVTRLHDLGSPHESHTIAAFKWGRPGGTSDLVIIPTRGREQLAIVEVKRGLAPDSHAQVVGQLLKYYVRARRITREGVRALRRELDKSGKGARRRGLSPVRILRVRTEAEANRILARGKRLTTQQIGLHVVVDRSTRALSDRLLPICNILREDHDLRVRLWEGRAGRLREIRELDHKKRP